MPESARLSFESRLSAALERMAPAEQRLARFIAAQKQRVVLGSAAQIAGEAGVSDATVVRTARALGYDSLATLREDLLQELTGMASPSRFLARTLAETGDDPAGILNYVVGLHEGLVAALSRPDFAAAFARSLDLVAAASLRHVFGVGPSGAVADYAALQLNRIGLRSVAITASGVGLADRLLWVEPGHVVVMLAYAPLYREVRLVLDRAEAQGVPVILVSDSLGPHVGDRVAEVLPVPRGRADHLAMHAGTMVLIEALVVGLAARDPDRALDALDDLSTLRGSIDPAWRKRGTSRLRGPRKADADG